MQKRKYTNRTFNNLCQFKVVLYCCLFFTSNILNSQEICEDGIDNDQDGYVDSYDVDCPCNDAFFQANCEPDCIDINIAAINIGLKWKTKVLNKGAKYSPRNIIVSQNKAYLTSHRLVQEGVENYITEIDLLTSNSKKIFVIDTTSSNIAFDIAIYRDAANISEFLIGRSFNVDLFSFDIENEVGWTKSNVTDNYRKLRYIKLSDFNNDGIPEIYSGNSVISNSGNLLFKGSSSEGCNFINEFNLCSLGANSIAANFTDHPGLELACGNVVYEIDFNNTFDSIGNSVSIVNAPIDVLEGYTGMGDFDSDGRMEVVSSRGNGNDDGGIWIWNPRNQSILASLSHLNGERLHGGIPIIGDINQDCVPEIVLIFKDNLSVFTYDGSNELKLLYNISGQDESGFTSPTIFDLNGDGIMEIISRDEEYIYIFDGPTGVGLDSFPILSITGSEQPIITDTDNDGHAEILIHGSDDHPDSLRLFCLESATTPWAPARKVWNQSGYHVTNVNDDLTIPQYQQSSTAFFDTDSCYYETCPQVYNTFGVQATFRTQKGCIVPPQDTTHQIEILGDNLLLCPGDTAVFTVDEMFEDIYWTSDGMLSCVDCDSVEIVSDTSVWLVVETIDNLCSSIDSIFIEIKPQIVLPDTAQLCFGDSILFYGQILKASGSYDYEINDCDSIATLELTIFDQITEDLTLNICDEDSIVINDSTFYSDGLYEIPLMASNGCDSILNLDLSFLQSTEYQDTFQICEGDSALVEGGWYFGGDLISLTIENSVGCDSIIDIFIEDLDVLSDSVEIVLCEGDSILIDNVWIKEEGDYTEEYMASSGCDSIFTFMVSLDLVSTEDIERELCNGDTLVVENVELFEAGIHEVFTTSSSGCDSIISVDLNILELIDTMIMDVICEGDSIWLIDQWISMPGEYTFDLTAENGCDSVINLEVSEILPERDTLDVMLCEGDSILINSEWIKNTGIYFDTVNTSNCILIIQSDVIVTSELTGMSAVLICQGDSIVLGNQTITEPGDYPILYESISGCDSLHTYSVDFSDVPDPPFVMYNCDMEEFEVFVEVGNSWDILWSNGSVESSTFYMEAGEESVVLTDNNNCSLEYSITIPSFSTFSDFVTIPDQVISLNDSLSITLGLDGQEWSIIWNTSVFISCDTCLSTLFYTEDESIIEYTLTNSEGCSETFSFLVSINDNSNFDFPNIFSPNGDNINDEFILDLSDIPINELKIYDRWGGLMYFSKNQETIRWNGTINNSPLENGVYVYILRYTDEEGKAHLKTGDITLMR